VLLLAYFFSINDLKKQGVAFCLDFSLKAFYIKGANAAYPPTDVKIKTRKLKNQAVNSCQ